jgi:hypothetical protein
MEVSKLCFSWVRVEFLHNGAVGATLAVARLNPVGTVGRRPASPLRARRSHTFSGVHDNHDNTSEHAQS